MLPSTRNLAIARVPEKPRRRVAMIFWFPRDLSFQIASWDWAVAADWCWNCDSDDFAVYQDPDHDGWYLPHNIHTGAYVHAMYMGT